MIAKISSGKDIYGLIEYHEQKILDGNATLLLAKDFYQPHQKLFLKTFRSLMNGSLSTKENTFHVSLNLPENENLTDNKFIEMGEEYMKEMGYGDQPYVIYRHHDKKNQAHIHIVSVRINEKGRRINCFQELNRNKALCRVLEEKYGLQQVSTVKQKKSGIDKVHIPTAAALNNSSQVKRYISIHLKNTLQYTKPRNLQELQVLLLGRKIGFDLVYSKENTTQVKGLIYYIKDANGKRISCAVKASHIYFDATLKKLDQDFIKHIGKFQEQPALALKVKQAFGQSSNFKDLRLELEKNKIRLLKVTSNILSNSSITYPTYYFLDQQSGYLHTANSLNIGQREWERMTQKDNVGLAMQPINSLFDAYPDTHLKKKRKKRRSL